jgi:hypothetical protein
MDRAAITSSPPLSHATDDNVYISMASSETMFPVDETPSSFGPRPASPADAVELLRADHRQLVTRFSEYERAARKDKGELADRICAALSIHHRLEEEIFYPAYLQATGDRAKYDESMAEHAGAKQLIAQIEMSPSTSGVADARITTLSRMVSDHVDEEERPGGMFAAALDSAMDLPALGVLIQVRKDQLRTVATEQPHGSGGSGTESVEAQSQALLRATSELASDEFDVQG